jgi:hypothetical protein
VVTAAMSGCKAFHRSTAVAAVVSVTAMFQATFELLGRGQVGALLRRVGQL